MSPKKEDAVWQRIREETAGHAADEPILASFLHATILNHAKLERALSFHLANQLDSPTASSLLLREVMLEAFKSDADILEAVRADLCAVMERDSACHELYIPFLYFKGFTRCRPTGSRTGCGSRVVNPWRCFSRTGCLQSSLWTYTRRRELGRGIMLDHATGLVIGETAVVGNNVSILQSVTLGGTGKDEGDRHPKIGDGVLISAGAKILGNIRVGEGAKVGAGSVVLDEVPPHTTVAGVPAKVVGRPASDQPALEMEHDFCCDESAAAAKQEVS